MIQLLGAPMLLGLGTGEPIDAFLLANPHPSSSDVASFLKAFGPDDRELMAQRLIGRGVSAATISSALRWLETTGRFKGAWPTISGVLVLASAGASAYHGYKRNDSIPWALWWFLMGSIFPVVTPVIGLAQGYGKKKAN